MTKSYVKRRSTGPKAPGSETRLKRASPLTARDWTVLEALQPGASVNIKLLLDATPMFSGTMRKPEGEPFSSVTKVEFDSKHQMNKKRRRESPNPGAEENGELTPVFKQARLDTGGQEHSIVANDPHVHISTSPRSLGLNGDGYHETNVGLDKGALSVVGTSGQTSSVVIAAVADSISSEMSALNSEEDSFVGEYEELNEDLF